MSKATQTLRNSICVPRQRELVRGLIKGEVAESYRPLSEGYVDGVRASIERARLKEAASGDGYLSPIA